MIQHLESLDKDNSNSVVQQCKTMGKNMNFIQEKFSEEAQDHYKSGDISTWDYSKWYA